MTGRVISGRRCQGRAWCEKVSGFVNLDVSRPAVERVSDLGFLSPNRAWNQDVLAIRVFLSSFSSQSVIAHGHIVRNAAGEVFVEVVEDGVDGSLAAGGFIWEIAGPAELLAVAGVEVALAVRELAPVAHRVSHLL